jgi:hypothetical protein
VQGGTTGPLPHTAHRQLLHADVCVCVGGECMCVCECVCGGEMCVMCGAMRVCGACDLLKEVMCVTALPKR